MLSSGSGGFFGLDLFLKNPIAFPDKNGMKAPLCAELKPGPEDQRAFKRYQVNMTVLVQLVPEEGGERPDRQDARRCPRAAVVVTDLSLSGLVFIAARPFQTGSLVEIQFSLGAHVHSICAVIKRCRPLALPGRRAFHCAAQLARSEGVSRFIPAVAKYLHHRYGA